MQKVHAEPGCWEIRYGTKGVRGYPQGLSDSVSSEDMPAPEPGATRLRFCGVLDLQFHQDAVNAVLTRGGDDQGK